MYNRCLFRDKMVRNRREGEMRGEHFGCKGEGESESSKKVKKKKTNENGGNAKLENTMSTRTHSNRPLPPISSSLDRENVACVIEALLQTYSPIHCFRFDLSGHAGHRGIESGSISRDPRLAPLRIELFAIETK